MWRIHNTVNTVKVSKKCAQELFRSVTRNTGFWNDVSEVTDRDGVLIFNEDHYEHMDFLWLEEIQKVLLKHKVKGDICFASLEGDNAGSFWGYRFDGKGGGVKLDGEIVYTETPLEKLSKKTR